MGYLGQASNCPFAVGYRARLVLLEIVPHLRSKSSCRVHVSGPQMAKQPFCREPIRKIFFEDQKHAHYITDAAT